MSKTPFFSIIIPVYNSEKYLNDCIKSIFDQTCHDFEVILVDDESTDRSSIICDDWSAKYPLQVHVIHQNNQGVYISKRNGIKHSKGQFIYVMDNDDLLVNNNAFKEIKTTILNCSADLIIFKAIDNLETGHLVSNLPFYDGQVFEGKDLSIIYDYYLESKKLHHLWMMVFNRNLFDWEYEYNYSRRMLRDGPSLILPIISNASKIVFLDEIIYYWRIQNQESASKHYDVENFYYSVRSVHQRLLGYYKAWNYKSTKTEELIHSNYMTDISIAAIKARSLPATRTGKKEFLIKLSEDDYFKAEYTLKHVDLFRIPIVFALYHKQYWFVLLLSDIAGFIKKR